MGLLSFAEHLIFNKHSMKELIFDIQNIFNEGRPRRLS